MEVAAAICPPIISGSIGPERPYIDNNVQVLISYQLIDPLGQSYTISGLTATIYWSRDGINYDSVSMSAVGSLQYQGSIPSQDGEEYAEYDAGAGQLYVYVMLENIQNERSFWYTPEKPNTDVYYIEFAGQQPAAQPKGEVITEQLQPNPILAILPESYLNDEFLLGASLIIATFGLFFMPNLIANSTKILYYIGSSAKTYFFGSRKGGFYS